MYIDVRLVSCFLHRAIDIQALIGNIGGYIGLCLGYSILQIPGFVLMIVSKIRKRRLTSFPNCKNENILVQIFVEEVKTDDLDNLPLSRHEDQNILIPRILRQIYVEINEMKMQIEQLRNITPSDQ